MIREQGGLRNLHNHPDQPFMNELIGGNRFLKDYPFTSKGRSHFITSQGRTQGTTGDPVACGVETLEDRFEAFCLREEVLLWNHTIFKYQKGRWRGSIRELSLNQRGLKAWRFGFHQKTPYLSIQFCPDQGHMSNGTIGDPHFGAIEYVTTLSFFST